MKKSKNEKRKLKEEKIVKKLKEKSSNEYLDKKTIKKKWTEPQKLDSLLVVSN